MRRWSIAMGVLAACGASVAACLPMPHPAAPIRSVTLSESSAAARDCLIVFMPGLGDSPRDFAEHGFLRALAAQGIVCDAIGVEAHLGYYFQRNLPDRLEEDVLAPARRRGYRRIWLAGNSIGGFGCIVTAKHRPELVDGVLAIAPYFPGRQPMRDIERAGGLARWKPDPGRGDYELREIWEWLKGYAVRGADRPPLYLAFGESDRKASAHRLLAAGLPSSHVVRREGGHKWKVWKRLWPELIARAKGDLTRRP